MKGVVEKIHISNDRMDYQADGRERSEVDLWMAMGNTFPEDYTQIVFSLYDNNGNDKEFNILPIHIKPKWEYLVEDR